MNNEYRTPVIRTGIRMIGILAIALASKLSPSVGLGQDAQEVLSLRLQSLQQQILAGDSDTVGDFWGGLKGKLPLVEPIEGDSDHSLVTFLWRGDKKTHRVLLIGGLPDAQLHKPLARLPTTDVWYRTERLHKKTRMTYAFRVNAPRVNYKRIEDLATSMGEYPPTPDPQNPRRSLIFSLLELSHAPRQPWCNVDANVPKGQLLDHSFRSRALKKERQFTVYVPAEYNSGTTPCHLLVFFDAECYTNRTIIPTPTILDNLIADNRIPGTVVVFIKNTPHPIDRIDDLACSPGFADFVATELVPWVRKRYRVTTDPSKAAVCGVSLGGLTAAYCGLKHSSVFGNVLTQSGTYSYSPGYVTKLPEYDTRTGWLTREFVNSKKLALRFYLEVGLFERHSRVDPVLEHRRLRDVLKSKGYPVVYSEFYGGHDYVCWRGSLADGLIALFGNAVNRPDSSQRSPAE